MTWNWTDEPGGTGLDDANCTTATTSTGQGSAIELHATCADLAGNTRSASSSVKVDKTPPAVTCAATPTFTTGGAHAANVTASVTDALSGPAGSTAVADVTAADVATAGRKAKSLTGSDVAGNRTTISCPYVVTAPVTISVADAAAKEGTPAKTKARTKRKKVAFTVTLSRAASAPVAFAFATRDGTAKAGKDYVTKSGTRTFQPGQTTIKVAVRIIPDSRREKAEKFALVLSEPQGATLADGRAVGKIKNDDRRAAMTRPAFRRSPDAGEDRIDSARWWQ